MEEILDRENKRMADSLASKVTRLKSVSGGPPVSPPPGTLEQGSEGGSRPGRVSRSSHLPCPIRGSTHLCEAQVTLEPPDLCWRHCVWQSSWQGLLVL